MKTRHMPMFLFLLILFTIFYGNNAFGKPAPQFQLPGLDGKMYSLNDFLGRPVVLTFFTTKCGFCAEELPILNELYRNYQQSSALQVIAINLGESKDAIEKMKKSIPYDYLTLLDKKAELRASYQILGVPTAYFIDPLGNVVDFIIGATKRETIMKKLGRIMWYRGLRDIEIENLFKVYNQIDVLDFRSSKENTYADKANVRYIMIQDINNELHSLDPNRNYLILTNQNEESIKICQQLALNGFQKIFYKINEENQ